MRRCTDAIVGQVVVPQPEEGPVTGAVVATISPSPSVSPSVVTYDYLMNGVPTGVLYLIESIRQCVWYGFRSRIQTQWHGRWHESTSGGIAAYFDFKGRHLTKWSMVDSSGQGHYYRGRTVTMLETRHNNSRLDLELVD